MELILIRHAEPDVHEDDPAGVSAVDPPLGRKGRAQAVALADWLARSSLHRVVSSPARRARQTAEPILARTGLELTIDERLRDVSERGRRYTPIEVDKARDPKTYRARVAAYRSGSGLAAISHRVNEAIDEWIAMHPGERVAVFCHGSVVNVYAARVLGLDGTVFLEAGYASAHRFMISRAGTRSVRSLNETAYL